MKSQAQNREERPPKILDQMRNLMRLHHYSIHTERSYSDCCLLPLPFRRGEGWGEGSVWSSS